VSHQAKWEYVKAIHVRCCQAGAIQSTRRRPDQEGRQRPCQAEKLDPRPHAHGLRPLRLPQGLAAMKALYRHELRLFQDLFLLCGGDQLAVA
jgi:hypothetical protein